jgi:hypothetical protein
LSTDERAAASKQHVQSSPIVTSRILRTRERAR